MGLCKLCSYRHHGPVTLGRGDCKLCSVYNRWGVRIAVTYLAREAQETDVVAERLLAQVWPDAA